ncbi:MAG: GNAT family N-acetyltransferase [Tannerella sp.]|jgi:phosphinothricin acetyltransferase|nr:GNAT family N-acetyltransferase [Tannerella sp.]
MIRNVTPEDAEAIAGIYNYYVTKTIITFETEIVSAAEMRERITTLSAHYPYFVYEMDGRVTGYCYAALWKKRHAYHTTVESTIYVEPGSRNKGIGRALMQRLIEALKPLPVHAVIACISIPNPESIRLHETFGFEKVSHFREVGWKFDIWVDVGDWELLL